MKIIKAIYPKEPFLGVYIQYSLGTATRTPNMIVREYEHLIAELDKRITKLSMKIKDTRLSIRFEDIYDDDGRRLEKNEHVWMQIRMHAERDALKITGLNLDPTAVYEAMQFAKGYGKEMSKLEELKKLINLEMWGFRRRFKV